MSVLPVDALLWYLPATHAMHFESSVLAVEASAWYFPEMHAPAHFVLSVLPVEASIWYRPATHTPEHFVSSMLPVESSTWYVPARHVLEHFELSVLPVERSNGGWYRPATHPIQSLSAARPVPLPHLPFEQSPVHLTPFTFPVDASSWNFPAAHAPVHDDASMLPREASTWNLPAGHAPLQGICPSELQRPAAHSASTHCCFAASHTKEEPQSDDLTAQSEYASSVGAVQQQRRE
jgi:hypothetical protein